MQITMLPGFEFAWKHTEVSFSLFEAVLFQGVRSKPNFNNRSDSLFQSLAARLRSGLQMSFNFGYEARFSEQRNN